MNRIVFALIWCTALLVGCQREVSGLPAPGSSYDISLLSLAAVEKIGGMDHLTREVDTDEPLVDTYLTEGPCHEVSDQRTAFGDGWIYFRSVADTVDREHGDPLAPIVSLVQNVIAYPDDDGARAVFERYVVTMGDCAASGSPGLNGKVERPDQGTAIWVTEGMASVFAIKGTVLVSASAVAVPDAERVAIDMSRAILDRIA